MNELDEPRKMKGKDRNALCWCNSGKKYKKCHWNRDNLTKDNPWDALNVNRKAFTTKKCCAHDRGLGDCDGKVIKAHTISRGPSLSKIAQYGHVLHYTTNIGEMNRNGGKLSAQKIGIKEASVFYGFCSKHDRELFSCIENEAFSASPNQCLAVAYRTLSRELYGKDAGAHLRETLRGADKGMTSTDQLMVQNILDIVDTGNEAARLDLKATHDALTAAMANSEFNVISSLIFKFAAPLPFMFSGAWSPFTDLYGRELQKGSSNERLEQIFVSSFAGDFTSMICISWRNIDGAPGKVIAEQIKALPVEKQASACLQLVTKHVENIFFNPVWFQDLDGIQREQLNLLAADGLDFMGSIPSATVRLDIDFPLPQAS